MPTPRPDPSTPAARAGARAVIARVVRGRARETEARFRRTFTVGAAEGCDLRLDDPLVAPLHLQVLHDGVLWWIRDLQSPSGTYAAGTRVQVTPLSGDTELELGRGGPVVSLALSAETRPRSGGAAREDAPEGREALSEERLLERYERSRAGGPVGKETMILRTVIDRVHRRSSRRYRVAVAGALVALAVAGAVVVHQTRRIHALRSTAERLFYTARTIELRTAKLEELVLVHADPKQVAELAEARAKLRQMESEYDAFVEELGIYARLSPDERQILRVARLFGECEVNVPEEFVAEVKRYVERWRTTDRLTRAFDRARRLGYPPEIARAFSERHLPPQYIYLALQESAFDDRAVGPPTRYGFAKGMWQFISLTGHRYGLAIGPLYDQAVYDPADERFDWRRATRAAVRYIADLHATDAQASGLLVMASYNWGEHNVRDLVRSLPENPRDRNFWRLLAHRRVPAETYDYVLSIFSAAVICEDPRVFGMEVECPLPPRGRHERL
jgi:hypothetical protein